MVKTGHSGFLLSTLENLMKDWPVGSYLVRKSSPIFPIDRPLMAIIYKQNSSKVLVFIATEGSGSTKSGDPYLSRYPDNYYNVSILSVVCTNLLGSYFHTCSSMENHDRMGQYELVVEKYWVTQSVYFRLATTVALGVGITYGKILFYHGISEGN